MKLLIIQLSDMHFENEDQVHSVKTDKMIATINAVVHADECIIIISGDMASKGKEADYIYVKKFVGKLLFELNKKSFKNKKNHAFTIPVRCKY